MTGKIRVMIVDDHKIVREGLKAFLTPLLDMEIVGEAKDGSEAVERVDAFQPDVILMDIMMPKMDGIQATHLIKEKNARVQILVITSFAEDEKVVAAIHAGAAGYLLKDASPYELQTAIQDVFRGESSLPPRIASMVLRELKRVATPEHSESFLSLTSRELEILKMVAHGLSNQEIADQLTLSVWTVRTHITNILTKLALENRTQAALYALREGIVALD